MKRLRVMLALLPLLLVARSEVAHAQCDVTGLQFQIVDESYSHAVYKFQGFLPAWLDASCVADWRSQQSNGLFTPAASVCLNGPAFTLGLQRAGSSIGFARHSGNEPQMLLCFVTGTETQCEHNGASSVLLPGAGTGNLTSNYDLPISGTSSFVEVFPDQHGPLKITIDEVEYVGTIDYTLLGQDWDNSSAFFGVVTIDLPGLPTPTKKSSWGSLKAIYR